MSGNTGVSMMAQERPASAPVGPVRRVVVPVGGMDREFLAQEQAVLFAAALDVPLTAVHVSSAPDRDPKDLFRYVSDVARKAGVECETVSLIGTDPVEVILDELDALDLVILGTERLADRFHIGGVTQRLMARSPGPVQVVRLGGYDSEASPDESRKAFAD